MLASFTGGLVTVSGGTVKALDCVVEDLTTCGVFASSCSKSAVVSAIEGNKFDNFCPLQYFSKT